MSMNNTGSFEAFLVEDLILTLANLRASLDWLAGTSGAGGSHRAGWQRFDRQLEMLEARARDLLDSARRRAQVTPGSASPPAPQSARPDADDADGDWGIDNIFLTGVEAGAATAVFQSRRQGV